MIAFVSGRQIMKENPFKSPVEALLPDFQSQESRFRDVFILIDHAIAAKAFPGASLAVTLDHQLIVWKAFGRFTYESESPAVSPTTIYDIASLTKVVATTAMAMILFDRGQLDLEAPVVAHSAGVRILRCTTWAGHGAHAAGTFFRTARVRAPIRTRCVRADLIEQALALPLALDPMTRVEYSDIGFIVLGMLLERVADETLDLFCEREVFTPLECRALLSTFGKTESNDSSHCKRHCVSHEGHCRAKCTTRMRSVLGGVSGHAGSVLLHAGHRDPRDTPSCTAALTSCVPRPSSYSPGENRNPSAHPGRSDGTLLRTRRNPEATFLTAPLDISATPVHRCGAILNGNSQSRCSQIASGPTVHRRRSSKYGPPYTTPSWRHSIEEKDKSSAAQDRTAADVR